MPPKRKIVSSGRSAKKRRVTATAPTEPDVVTTTSTTVSQGPAIARPNLPIDLISWQLPKLDLRSLLDNREEPLDRVDTH